MSIRMGASEMARAYLSRVSSRVEGVEGVYVVVSPMSDNWNDMGTMLRAEFTVYKSGRCLIALDGKFVVDGCNYLKMAVNELVKEGYAIRLIEAKFKYCSLFRDPYHYLALRSYVDSDEAKGILEELHDLSYLRFSEGVDPTVDFEQRWIVFKGLLRTNDYYFSYMNGNDYVGEFAFKKLTVPSTINFEFKHPRGGDGVIFSLAFNEENDFRGRMTALVGVNGSGKTSLLNALVQYITAENVAMTLNDNPRDEREKRSEIEPIARYVNKVIYIKSIAGEVPVHEDGSALPTPIAYWDPSINSSHYSYAKPALWVLSLVREYTWQPSRYGIGRFRSELMKAAVGELLWTALALKLKPDNTISDSSKVKLQEGEYVLISGISSETQALELGQFADLDQDPVFIKNKRIIQISSGQNAIFKTLVFICSQIDKGSIVCLDEPETSLHPLFVSEFIIALDTILKHSNSLAVISSHSPYIVRELPSSQVNVLTYVDNCFYINKPNMQTFGASLDKISQFVFEDTYIQPLHKKLIEQWARNHPMATESAMLTELGAFLSVEAKSYARRVLSKVRDDHEDGSESLF